MKSIPLPQPLKVNTPDISVRTHLPDLPSIQRKFFVSKGVRGSVFELYGAPLISG
jgi:hypothetical protein